MVMADISGHDRIQRRPKYTRKGPAYDNSTFKVPDKEVVPMKTPVILTKPQAITQVVSATEKDEDGETNNHLMIGKTLIVNNNNHIKMNNRSGFLVGDHHHHQQQQQQPSALDDKKSGANHLRLVLPPEMTHSVKMIDDQAWSDSGLDCLIDQSDFLVIGIVGCQGVGKSTIMSYLAGAESNQSYKSFVFKPQNKEAILTGSHMTYGIDMYVTEERTILLDSQAVLSPAVLDGLIYQDKKCPLEYSHIENAVEIQSLKTVSFMLTVCNVIIVVVDWIIDNNIIKFLYMAEMLKPIINNSGGDKSSAHDSREYYPHIVFVLNKASGSDFEPKSKERLGLMLSDYMSRSKLKFTGLSCGRRIPFLPPTLRSSTTTMAATNDLLNFFILPINDDNKQSDDLNQTIGYVGHKRFDQILSDMRRSLLSVPRNLPTPASISEKTWFHSAAKVWDFIKRSPMMSEYNRLLS